jgi:hypothetical protein
MTTMIAPSTPASCVGCRPPEHTIGGHYHSGTLIADYNRWRDLMLLTLRRYALDDHVLSDVADPSVY